MSKKWSDLKRSEKDGILENYFALEAVDRNKDFQQRARLLQSLWRDEQRLKPALWRGKLRGNLLEMPEAKTDLSNYLTQNIRDMVRYELKTNWKRPMAMRGLYAEPRIFNNLLSSQPLCFNLFGELTYDFNLATRAFSDLTDGRIAQVSEIRFEYSPGRENPKYTGDKSAFDVYVKYITAYGENGFVGIEVKYHENPNKVEYKKDRKDGITKPAEELYFTTHGVRYEGIATDMECFLEDDLDNIRKKPIQQFWRDHLLAGAHKRVDGFEDAFFAVLYPDGNTDCRKAVNDYRQCLDPNDRSFEVWTLDQFVECLRQHSSADWIRSFHYRYLDFTRLPTYVSPVE